MKYKTFEKLYWNNSTVKDLFIELKKYFKEDKPKQSKEEQSQRIMMEQVDKDKVWIEKTGIKSPNTGMETMIIHNAVKIAKQNKIVCEHCKFVPNGIIKINDDGKCIYCDKQIGLTKKQMKNLSPPIEDTNKTRLVPEKIAFIINAPEDKNTTLRELWEKQCEIIDYLTLISLNKKI